MIRPVECVLVGTGDKASRDALEVMRELVRSRFAICPVVLAGAQATKDHVTAAVTGAAHRCPSGGLFILMFSGHGGLDERAHYWQLIDACLRDVEVLELLGRFREGVEIVVISDCCYGAGILRGMGEGMGMGEALVSQARLALATAQREKWESQMRDRRQTFVHAAAAAPPGPTARAPGSGAPPRPIVLISATDWILIRSSARNQFIRALAAALGSAATYGELRAQMLEVSKPEGQSNWDIHIAPAEARQLPPLAPVTKR